MLFISQTVLCTCILLFNIVSQSNGHSNGQGIMASCFSFDPGHGVSRQTTPSPYKIMFSPQSYRPGSPVSVTLSTCSGQGFQGFLIQARRADNNLNQFKSLGNFIANSNTIQTCPEDRALSHSDGTSKSAISFSWNPPSIPQGHIVFRVTFVRDYNTFWADVVSDVLADESINRADTSRTLMPSTPLDVSCHADIPSTTTQNIPSTTTQNIHLTTAQNIPSTTTQNIPSTTTQNIPSTTTQNIHLTTAQNIPSTTTQNIPSTTTQNIPSTTTQNIHLTTAQNIHPVTNQKLPLTTHAIPSTTDLDNNTTQFRGVLKDRACGLTKGCLSNCKDSTTCNFVILWSQKGEYGIYTITAEVVSSTGAYVALGFSGDDQMGDDSVTGCAVGAGGLVTLFNGHNTGKSSPTLFIDNNVTLESHTNSDGVLSCTFSRLKAASADGTRVDISKPWIILFATGPATVSTNNDVSLQYHGPANHLASSAEYKVSDTIDSEATKRTYPLIKAHGSLMVGAWLFFSSVGIVAARYYKGVWNNLIYSQKVWFQIHRASMLVVFSATVAGFIIIFIEVKGWSELVEPAAYVKAHPIIGVIVAVLTVINPIMAIFRPHPETPRRPIFNWVHWFVGSTAHILAVITIFFGVQLNKAFVPDYLTYILAVYVAWQIFVMLVLELVSCYGRRGDRKDIYELQKRDSNSFDDTLPVFESSLSILVKRIIFVTHAIVVGVLAVSAIVIISMD